MFEQFLARQLGSPSGVFGRFVLAPLWNRRNSTLNDMALQRLELKAEDRVLEVGFGGGYLLGRMLRTPTDGCLAGVDASATMVSLCGRRYRSHVQTGKLELQCARAEALPYPAGRFTKVCSVNSIFYWENASQAIRECQRVLCDAGRVVVCFTSKESLTNRGFAHHRLTLYEQDDVVQMMRTAGFREIEAVKATDRYRTFWCVGGTK